LHQLKIEKEKEISTGKQTQGLREKRNIRTKMQEREEKKLLIEMIEN
jgi:hypothetical protein